MFVTERSSEWNELLKRLKNNDASLTLLHLYSKEIGDSEAKELSEALKENRTITLLYLSYNQIGDSGFKDLSGALKGNRTLTHLHLSSNRVGNTGAKDFSEVLKENHTLTLLYLDFNKIGASGAKNLSEALKENHTLTQLYLGSNQIGARGPQDFSEVLKVNRTLTLLDLDLNQIGASGAKDLSETLKENRTLIQLRLGDNQIGNSGAKDFSEALKENRTLTLLRLYNNQIKDSNITKSIDNFLARNKDLVIKRRDQFIQAMIVLAYDSAKKTSPSHSLWSLLLKPLKLHIISFINFHPWESIDKTPQQISECVAYVFDNTDALEASLKEAVKTKQPFKIMEKPLDTTTNKSFFFFKPRPAQLATATTSECEKTYRPPYERQNQ